MLNKLEPIKKATYKTALSPQKVAQRLKSKISPEPKRKSIFDYLPLTYHGKIEQEKFEFGRRSRGQKDHPPTAYGTIQKDTQNPLETLVEVKIIPNHNFKTVVILFILIVSLACLPSIISVLNGYYESIVYFVFLPIFFSLGFFLNYLIFVNYNRKLAKDIQHFIDGKKIK